MITIFGVFKSNLLMMGISHGNEHSRVASLAKRIFVIAIIGSWGFCMLTGAIVSENLNIIVESLICSTFCFVALTMYTYMLYYKSKLFNLIDGIESSMNESKLLHFMET